jgi:hypothetical protein
LSLSLSFYPFLFRALEHAGTPSKATETTASSIRDVYKLIFGAGGIYVAFIYYGSLQEDVFNFKAPDGSTFQFAWFLQFLEALANIVVGYMGRRLVGGTEGLPMKQFYISGATQVFSKAFTSLALAKGLSFPVATLAKSGKMAPVMAGQLLLGGASYTIREYLQVAAIIGGTAVLSLGKKVCVNHVCLCMLDFIGRVLRVLVRYGFCCVKLC